MSRIPDPANRRGPGFVPGLIRVPGAGVQMRDGSSMGADREKEPKFLRMRAMGGLPKLKRYGQ